MRRATLLLIVLLSAPLALILGLASLLTAESPMPLHQRAVVVGVALALVLAVFEMVRKRRLREEYSWLWMLVAFGVAVAAVTPFELLVAIARGMGSSNPPAAIFFLGFIGVTLLCLQFSVRLSRMTEQIKNLGQKVSLLELALEEARGRRGGPDAPA